MEKLTNRKAMELFNLLNSMPVVEDSPRSIMQVKTLRSMKTWFERYNEEVELIDTRNCAVTEKDGIKILLKETLERKRKDKKGEDITEQYKVNVYTPEGQEKRTKELTKLLDSPVNVEFNIYKTDDDSGLKLFDKITLIELGFLKEKEDK